MAIAPTRKYELIIGIPTKQLDQIKASPVIDGGSFETPAANGSKNYTDSTTAPRDALVIDNLRVSANITLGKMGKGKKANPAIIKIYNAGDDTIRDIIAEGLVIFKAGYTTPGRNVPLPIVYAGQIIKVTTQAEREDIVTTINCGDSYTLKKNIRYKRSFNRQTSYTTIINDIISAFALGGVPKGRFILNDKVAATLKIGASYDGYIEDVLTKVTDGIDYRHYTAGGKLYVEPKDQDRTVEVVRITPGDIKDKIKPGNDTTTAHTNSPNKTVSGLKLTTFLNGNITLDKYITLVSGDFAGDYKIESIRLVMDSEGGPWDTELEVSAFKKATPSKGGS